MKITNSDMAMLYNARTESGIKCSMSEILNKFKKIGGNDGLDNYIFTERMKEAAKIFGNLKWLK